MFFIFFQIHSLSAQNTVLLKGNVQLSDGGKAETAEIFVFSDKYSVKEKDLIARTKVGKDGTFTLQIPASCESYFLHIAAPNYNFTTALFVPEKNALVSARLHRICMPDSTKSIKIIGDFCEFDLKKSYELKKNDAGIYEVEIYHDKSEIKYQLLFDDDEHSFSNPVEGEATTYDFEGDYINIAHSKSHKFVIKVNPAKFPRISAQKFESESQYPPGTRNTQIAILRDELKSMQNLFENYLYIVRRVNPDVIKNMSVAELEKATEKTQRTYISKIKFFDSLRSKATDTLLLDYINVARFRLAIMKDTSVTETTWNIFKEIKRMRWQYDDVVNLALLGVKSWQSDELNGNRIAEIEEKIQKTPTLAEQPRMLVNLFLGIQRNANGKGKFTEKILSGLNEIAALPEKEQAVKLLLPLVQNEVMLAFTEQTPDFDFNDIDNIQHKLSSFRGKWVLLNFTIAANDVCKKEFPFLTSGAKKFKEKNFILLNIFCDENFDLARKFIRDYQVGGINMSSSKNISSEISGKYGVQSFPSVYLINPAGKILKLESSSLRGQKLEKTLSEYIK